MEQPSEKLEYCVERNIAEMFELLKYCISQKKIVTIADNAYANGGDLGIVKILNNNHLLMKVDGYAGWNTSANTLGTAIAEGVDSYLNKVTEEHQMISGRALCGGCRILFCREKISYRKASGIHELF